MPLDKGAHSQHISQKFNEELEQIRAHLLEMGGMVERQVQEAIRALVDTDSGIAQEVQEADTNVNRMEVSIDDECIKILARRQPAASDLRLVFAIIKAITDLERIGDEAGKIAKQAIHLSEQGQPPRGYVEARHISNLVIKMLRGALDAFARLDSDQALAVAQQDKQVDLEYASAMRALATYMMEDPRSIKQVLNVIWALRSLERIGDHARNLAEYVIYLVEGKDVRHIGLTEMAETLQSGN